MNVHRLVRVNEISAVWEREAAAGNTAKAVARSSAGELCDAAREAVALLAEQSRAAKAAPSIPA
jgi:hypothetical protein